MNHHGFIPLVPRGSKRIYAFGTQPLFGSMQDKENFPIGSRYSDDDGRTWSKPQLIRPLNDPGYQGMSVMRMCETDRGTWLLGTHRADWTVKPLHTSLYLSRSSDRGKTWMLPPGKRPGGWEVPQFHRIG
jgi:Neuraminidase (sialidase)